MITTADEADASLLIVDDEPIAIKVLHSALAAYGDVRFATNATDALRIARERAPDLILLDSEMPGGNGFEVCQALKADARLKDIPVIFVTAHDDPVFEGRALQLGAADFIGKPISPARVQLRVRLHLQLKARWDRLRSQATSDPLTGLANRRLFDERLQHECARAERAGQPLSLFLVDVDCFKAYNDTYGHPAGDECLERIASSVSRAARRPADLAARIGGEEFAVLLPETPLQNAAHVAEELRRSVRDQKIRHGASATSDIVTVSVGVAELTAKGGVDAAPPRSPRLLIQRADHALYSAKVAGRDRVVVAESDDSPAT